MIGRKYSDEFKRTVPSDLPELEAAIAQAQRNFEKISQYSEGIFKSGVVQVLKTELEAIKESVDKEYPELLQTSKLKLLQEILNLHLDLLNLKVNIRSSRLQIKKYLIT